MEKKVVFSLLSDKAILPSKATDGSAAMTFLHIMTNWFRKILLGESVVDLKWKCILGYTYSLSLDLVMH